MQEILEECALAEDANAMMEEENVALRQQLAQVQQQLQAIRDPAPPVMTQPQVPRDLSLAEAFGHCMRGPTAMPFDNIHSSPLEAGRDTSSEGTGCTSQGVGPQDSICYPLVLRCLTCLLQDALMP